MSSKEYGDNIIVIGGGPAGCTAGVYLARAGIDFEILRTVVSPSQISYTETLENYPGIGSVSGFDFLQMLEKQVADLGGDIVEAQVTSVRKEGAGFVVGTSDGQERVARGVIIATGARSRPLGVPGEEEFRGRGVSYCGTCDGAFFRGKRVVVVGGGDTAAEEGLFLSRLASKVYLVHRRDRMRAQASLADRFLAQVNVEPVWNSVVAEIRGGDTVEKVLVKDVGSGQVREIEADGVFIFVGQLPNTEPFRDLAPLDEGGFVLADEDMATSVEGLFAAGDCRRKRFRQVVTACADGAIAAYSAQRFIEALTGAEYPGR